MSLYKWSTELYNILKMYIPRSIKSKWKIKKCFWKTKKHYNFGVLSRMSLSDLNTAIVNSDIYLAGIQLILNLGFTHIEHSPIGDYAMLSHPVEDGKHVREYRSNVGGGEMGYYYYPFKERTLMFK